MYCPFLVMSQCDIMYLSSYENDIEKYEYNYKT